MTTAKQVDGNVMEAPASAPASGRKLLKGGAAITYSILKKSDKEDIRWLYGQVPNLAGVVWQLTEGGELFAWEDELVAHFEMKAAEAKANALGAAEAKAAEKAALKTAAKNAQPSSHQSRPRARPQLRKASRVAAE